MYLFMMNQYSAHLNYEVESLAFLNENFRDIHNAYYSKLETTALETGLDFIDDLWSKIKLE